MRLVTLTLPVPEEWFEPFETAVLNDLHAIECGMKRSSTQHAIHMMLYKAWLEKREEPKEGA